MTELTYEQRRRERRTRPVWRTRDLPPLQRRAYERVTAYLAKFPDSNEMTACMATRVSYRTWRLAKERLEHYAKGVADDQEAFLEWDGQLLREIG